MRRTDRLLKAIGGKAREATWLLWQQWSEAAVVVCLYGACTPYGARM